MQRRQMPRQEDTVREDSHLMLRAEDVKPAQVTESLRLRCISWLMYMSLVRSARVRDITERPWKLSIRVRAYMMFLI